MLKIEPTLMVFYGNYFQLTETSISQSAQNEPKQNEIYRLSNIPQ